MAGRLRRRAWRNPSTEEKKSGSLPTTVFLVVVLVVVLAEWNRVEADKQTA